MTEILNKEDKIRELRKELFNRGSKFEPVKREDIVGIDNILNLIDEIIEWLRNYEKYRQYGTRLEPGIIFEGLPGSGKTLCSRYLATESNSRFINVRDYPIAGQAITAKDISDLFRDARRYHERTDIPVILFWDEFEGVAKSRDKISGGIRDETTASQLTAELDGINGKCPGLLLVGCTNYFKSIDKALIRPGRMGVHINFHAPDRDGKKVLLKHYISKYYTTPDIDVDTASFFLDEDSTAAKIEEVAALVWRKTVSAALKKSEEPTITSEFLSSALLDDLIGFSGSLSKLSKEARTKIAIHEIGHAIVARYLNIPIRIITIRPHGESYGRVITYTPDFHYSDIDEVFRMICVGLGSMEAESVAGLPPSTHSQGDTEYATALARQISETWGDNLELSRLNPSGLEGRSGSSRAAFLSDYLLKTMDGVVIDILMRAKSQAHYIVDACGKDGLMKLASQLEEDETWTGIQFDRIVDSI